MHSIFYYNSTSNLHRYMYHCICVMVSDNVFCLCDVINWKEILGECIESGEVWIYGKCVGIFASEYQSGEHGP